MSGASYFCPTLPEWLTVGDSKVARGYYEGDVNLYAPRTANRLGIACPLVDNVHLYTCFWMFCINVIVRKQWIEHEKLSYPIIQLPLQMTDTQRQAFFGIG